MMSDKSNFELTRRAALFAGALLAIRVTAGFRRRDGEGRAERPLLGRPVAARPERQRRRRASPSPKSTTQAASAARKLRIDRRGRRLRTDAHHRLGPQAGGRGQGGRPSRADRHGAVGGAHCRSSPRARRRCCFPTRSAHSLTTPRASRRLHDLARGAGADACARQLHPQ